MHPSHITLNLKLQVPDQGFLHGKTIYRGNSFFFYETQLLFPRWRLKGKHVFTSLFQILENERDTLKLPKQLSKAIYQSQIGLEKNGVTEKPFLGVLSFGHPCSSINRTDFNVEHENTCPLPSYIGSSINNISGHVLTCNCARKIVL